MAWKINKMVIENFKFFLTPFTLEPKGKHVLMYGENGSGKSSIYWAAYTHFQSCLKQPADAQKYFDRNHPDSLVNLYDTANRRSGIEIEFIDPADVKKSYTDGSWIVNTNVGDDFIRLSTYARTTSSCLPSLISRTASRLICSRYLRMRYSRLCCWGPQGIILMVA